MYRAPIRNLNRANHALLAVGAAALAACSTTPSTRPAQPRAAIEGQAASTALEARAQAEAQNGNLAAADGFYRQLAAGASGSSRARFLLAAARLEIRQNDAARAAATIEAARPAADAEQLRLIDVLLADIDVHNGQPADALARLAQLPRRLSVPVLAEADRVRGAALFATGRPADAVRALVERETWLDTAADVLANERMIWDGLAASPDAAAAAAASTGDPVVDGWLALAPVAAAHTEGTELRRALLEWRRRYASHPAVTGLLADMLRGQRSARGLPAQIALLLPLGSAQREAAVAIRDGFLGAHLSDPSGSDTAIRVYDTTTLGAEQAYDRAQLEGADFIVGPLLRPAVEQVVSKAGFVPTLALNFLQSQPDIPDDFYQFALAPEDEAREVADQAFATGARTAVVLYPLDPATKWGDRVLDSFRDEFQALGGEVLASASYDRAQRDFSAPIETVLNLDRSDQRRRRLAANLGLTLEAEPRRRQDVDMIFIGADRKTGLLLAPALRFHFAGDIPTYATSSIFEPGTGSGDDDLDGIIFPDAPWALPRGDDPDALRKSLETFWPARMASPAIQFYGMGADAYRLVTALYSPAGQWPLAGASGDLVLAQDGRIHREMPFAQFRDGHPVAVEKARPSGPRVAATP